MERAHEWVEHVGGVGTFWRLRGGVDGVAWAALAPEADGMAMVNSTRLMDPLRARAIGEAFLTAAEASERAGFVAPEPDLD